MGESFFKEYLSPVFLSNGLPQVIVARALRMHSASSFTDLRDTNSFLAFLGLVFGFGFIRIAPIGLKVTKLTGKELTGALPNQ